MKRKCPRDRLLPRHLHAMDSLQALSVSKSGRGWIWIVPLIWTVVVFFWTAAISNRALSQETPAGDAPVAVPGQSPALRDAVAWLEKEAHRIIRAAKRTMDNGVVAFPPQVGIGYEAFWLRDYAYTLEGSVDSYTNEELTEACRLFIQSLRSDGAGVDCVKFDGTLIYQPGYGSMGKNPVADGSQFTVAVAWHTYQKTRDDKLLAEIVKPLVCAMNAVPRDPDTHLVHIRVGDEWDRCPYGFTDTVRKQGDVLFCSLLYVQASRQLADLLQTLGRREDAEKWRSESEVITASIQRVFWDAQIGLFRAATDRCREHDIWGSAFAVYLGVADPEQSKAVASYFKAHYAELVQHGQVRHLPAGVYWEQAGSRDSYQNGAFWATPTGWFAYTLDLVDPQLADQTVLEMVADFQKSGACEWIFRDRHQLPNYLASASLPLAGIRAVIERRTKSAAPSESKVFTTNESKP